MRGLIGITITSYFLDPLFDRHDPLGFTAEGVLLFLGDRQKLRVVTIIRMLLRFDEIYDENGNTDIRESKDSIDYRECL